MQNLVEKETAKEMKMWQRLKCIMGLGFLGIIIPISLVGDTPKIPVVIIWNISNNHGKITLNIFKKDTDFPKQGIYKSIHLKAQKGALYIPVDIPDGKYALAAFHDEDSNGKINIGFFGPTEGYGFGNDASGILSPPSFEKSTLTFKKNMKTKIKIKY